MACGKFGWEVQVSENPDIWTNTNVAAVIGLEVTMTTGLNSTKVIKTEDLEKQKHFY